MVKQIFWVVLDFSRGGGGGGGGGGGVAGVEKVSEHGTVGPQNIF